MTNSELKSKLAKSLEFLETELSQIRTGRASPSLIEGVVVEAYGAKMTIREVASITNMDAQTLLVAPWDRSLLDAVAKAIREGDLHLNPVVGGDSLKVPLPPLTEERRKEFVKVVSLKLEECKNALRNTRQEAMKDIEKLFSDKKIGEDEKFSLKEEVEEVIKDFTSQAELLTDSKKQDLMTI
jgi:ribosome recycling factor